MAATYDTALTTDKDKVRYHIQDVDTDNAMFQDEEINAVITMEETWQKAVISLIKALITRLSHDPDFTSDWMRIDSKRSLAGYRLLLQEKRVELLGEAAGRSGRAKPTYRSDSYQREAPDW